MIKTDEYRTIDILKFIFSMLIPLLHISFNNSKIIYVISQYISRIGVPFFFATSGLFLYISIKKRGKTVAFKRYFKHIGIMLSFWLTLYLIPILYINPVVKDFGIKVFIFQTPAYLWYLSALLLASFLFSYVERGKYVLAVILYAFGVLFCDSYNCVMRMNVLTNQILVNYISMFLTSVNGLFFGFPLMCVGELVLKRNEQTAKHSRNDVIKCIIGLLFSLMCYCVEVYFVRQRVSVKADTSMYFTLPLVIFFIVKILLLVESIIKGKDVHFFRKLRRYSSAIYCIQFGAIGVGNAILNYLGVEYSFKSGCFVYMMVIIIPCCFVCILERNEKGKNILKYIL